MIALLGLVTAVVVTDFGMSSDAERAPTAYESLERAVAAGRLASLSSGAPVTLARDAETGALSLVSSVGAEPYALPEGCTVRFFLPADEAAGAELPLASLVFHPAGCVTPAVVALRLNGAETRYRLEPFSATLMPEAAP